MSIAQGTHNRGLIKLAEGLYTMMEGNLWPKLKKLVEEKQQRTQQHLDQHEELFECIQSRDSRRAENIMLRHLRTIEHEFNEDAAQNDENNKEHKE